RLRAKLYLPDASQGYYRGTRFDWSGVVASLEWNGHNYFGKWFEHHGPKLNDAITGPVEEFSTNNAGLGYDEAKPGSRARRLQPRGHGSRGQQRRDRTGGYSYLGPGTNSPPLLRCGSYVNFLRPLPASPRGGESHFISLMPI